MCAALLVGFAASADAQPTTEAVFEEAHQDKPDPVLSWSASLGLVYAAGNTSSWTLNAGTSFRVVRNRHAFSLDWAFAYGRTDLTPNDGSTGFVDTVRNSNTRARYDLYLTRDDAFFIAVGHRWDTFAGLDTRLQAQLGYLRNLIQAEKHRLWTELGYDFTYDNYVLTQDPNRAMDPACADTIPLEDRPQRCIIDGENVHAARAYIGYNNQLNPFMTVSAGLEALFNLQDGDDIRLNFDVALTSTLSEMFKIELKFKLLFDNVPVPDKGKYDSLLTANLVFNWEQSPEPADEEPAADQESAADGQTAEEQPADAAAEGGDGV